MAKGYDDQSASPNIHAAIHQHLAGHRRSGQPISINRAVAFVKRTVPNCTNSDNELADIIADHALLRGFSLDFDGQTASPVNLEEPPDSRE